MILVVDVNMKRRCGRAKKNVTYIKLVEGIVFLIL